MDKSVALWGLSFLTEKMRDVPHDLLIFFQAMLFYAFKVLVLPGGSVVKNPPDDAGNMGSIPESGRSPGEGNGSLLQYSCLRNPMDRGA